MMSVSTTFAPPREVTLSLLLPSPDALTYRFHQFRPSDRDELRRVAALPNGDQVFIAALERYLDTWAAGTWLQEYDVEVIAEWCVIHIGPLVPDLSELARQKRTGPGQSDAVYGLFLLALGKPADSHPAGDGARLGA